MNAQKNHIKFNKSMVAAALLTTVAMVPFAHAADVGIYGIADIAFSNIDWGQTGSKSFLTSGSGSGGSRIGFNVSQDLENGLTIKGNFEGGVNMANGTYGPLLYTRQATATLKGGFGSISAGQDYTLSYIGSWASDVCTWCGIASPMSLTLNGVRDANYLKYMSPMVGNFQFGLAHTFGADPNNSDVGDKTEGGVFYTKENINVNGTYRTQKLSVNDNLQDYYLNGNLGIGILKVYAMYGAAKSDNDTIDQQYTSLSVGIKAGSGTLSLVYAIVKDNAVKEDDSNFAAVLYYYTLGKGTTLYAQASKVSNDSNAGRSAWPGDGAPSTGIVGHDVTGVQVGLKYVFGAW
jgi:predicted porin